MGIEAVMGTVDNNLLLMTFNSVGEANYQRKSRKNYTFYKLDKLATGVTHLCRRYHCCPLASSLILYILD